MAGVERSETGVWLTLDSELVTVEPEAGVQIVPKGGVITPEVTAAIEAAKALAPSTPVAADPAPVVEPAPVVDDPAPVVEPAPVVDDPAPAKARGTVKKAAPRA